MAEGFDKNNPWHSNANLILAFMCQECDACIDFDDFDAVQEDVQPSDVDDEFLATCVALSQKAQQGGSTCKDKWEFLCPDCARSARGNPPTLTGGNA